MARWTPLQVAVAAHDWELVRFAARGSTLTAMRDILPGTPSLQELLARPAHLFNAATALPPGAHPLGGREGDTGAGQALVRGLEARYLPDNHELQPRSVRTCAWLLLLINRRLSVQWAEHEELQLQQQRAASDSSGQRPGLGGDAGGGLLSRRTSWRRRLSSVSSWVRRRRPPPMERPPIFDVWCLVFEALRGVLEQRAVEEDAMLDGDDGDRLV